MSPMQPSPLTADHYDVINNALRQLNEAQMTIAKASACGMDCRSHQELANYLHTQLMQMKQQFFPKGRPQ